MEAGLNRLSGNPATSAGSFINLHPQEAAGTRQMKSKLINGNLQFPPVINFV
jgi:hypothetical protein